jgi:hypothetical protein
VSELADETGVVDEPVAEGAVEEPAAVAEPTPAEPTLDPLELQAELEHTRSQLTELYSILEQNVGQGTVAQQAQQAQAQGIDVTDDYGNLDPAKFAAYQQARDQALLGQIGQMLQPLQQTFAQQQEAAFVAEGEQRLQDILADDVSRNGEFASDPQADAQARELVSTLAAQNSPDLAQRFGNGSRAAGIAMVQAAEQVRGLLRSVGGSAVTQTQNQLATLANQHGEPGAGGAGVEAPVIRLGETSASRFAAGGN